MVYKFFEKRSSGSGAGTKSNYQLANKLPQQIIKKLKKKKFI